MTAVPRFTDATFRVEADADLREGLCRALVEAGFGVARLNRAERELEAVFVELSRGPAEEGEP